jgi:hypothetical protein
MVWWIPGCFIGCIGCWSVKRATEKCEDLCCGCHVDDVPLVFLVSRHHVLSYPVRTRRVEAKMCILLFLGWGRAESRGTVAVNEPIVSIDRIDDRIESVALVEWQKARKPGRFEENPIPVPVFPTTDPICIAFGLNPVPRSKFPANNCLSYMAHTQVESSSCLCVKLSTTPWRHVRIEIQLLAFLTPCLCGSEWCSFMSRPFHLDTHWIWGRLGPRACLNTVERMRIYKTPWSESASELYRPSDRRLSAKSLTTFCG